MTPVVVLFSGGLDSTVLLALARSKGLDVHALTFDYGQRHAHEITAAIGQRVPNHRLIRLDLTAFGGSPLTTPYMPVPKDQLLAGVPSTYVPARNTVFLAHALAYAEVVGAFSLFIGASAEDQSGYPDCRPEYLSAFEVMANLATRVSVVEGGWLRVHSPLIEMTKADIIRLGTRLGVDFATTSTCYDPTCQGLACGHCDACRVRLRGFSEAGMKDPLIYA